MSAASSYTVEFHPAAFRIKYVETRRHVLLPITFTSADRWEIIPERIGWWEDDDGRRVPLTEGEKAEVIARVLARANDGRLPSLRVPGETAAAVENLSPADGEDTLSVDPEVAQFMEFEASPMPAIARMGKSADDAQLLAQIAAALAQVQPMADAGWEQAMSIARQLTWCRGALRGETVEPAPGPFSMGLIATREFDMYGSQPDLAMRINEIEQAMKTRLRG